MRLAALHLASVLLRRTTILARLAIVAAPALCGCDPDTRSTPSRAHAGQPASTAAETPRPGGLTPMQTIEYLRDMRIQGRYSRIEPFLPPEQCAVVIAQIRAVDRLIVAGSLLQNRAREHMGTGAAQSFDRYAQLANIAGVFSNDVAVIGQLIDGDRAQVSYSVAGRLPLKSVELLRRKGRWVMQCVAIEGVPELLIKLAFLLERMSELIVERHMTAAQLHREIELRQSTILRQMRKLITAAGIRAPSASAGTGS